DCYACFLGSSFLLLAGGLAPVLVGCAALKTAQQVLLQLCKVEHHNSRVHCTAALSIRASTTAERFLDSWPQQHVICGRITCRAAARLRWTQPVRPPYQPAAQNP